MQLTILGNSGSFPRRDGACSGYLLRNAQTTILIDCGNGILSRLQHFCDVKDLTAILISHHHFDHMGDLMLLRYGLETRIALGEKIYPIPIYIPNGPINIINELQLGGVFEIHLINDLVEIKFGEISVGFFKTEHPIECYGFKINYGGKKMVYSADSAFCETLITNTFDADLFLCEATFSGSESLPFEMNNHLTAQNAAIIAHLANVDRLLLTHFWYKEEPDRILDQAREIFPNSAIATELQTIEV